MIKVSINNCKYSDNIKNEYFKDKQDELKLICLDNIWFQPNYTDNKNKVKHYILKETNKTNKEFCNYLITKDGSIYKITPDDYSSNMCKFNLYSFRAARELPGTCPIYKLDENNNDTNPDKQIITIVCELDIETKEQSFSTEYALRQLCAYLMKKYNIKTSNIITRDVLTKDQKMKEKIGHIVYKESMMDLIKLSAYSSKMHKSEEISLNETDLFIV